MLSFQQAKEIAEKSIQGQRHPSDAKLIIVDSDIIEKPYAWIFPYSTKQWLEGDINYALGGNAPLFIDKQDGRISTFRTGLSIDGMIDEYEEQNKVWCLKITPDIYSNTEKLLVLKNVLKFSQSEIMRLKENNSEVVTTGSKRRLEDLAFLLGNSGIANEIVLTKT